jgi:ArsR family transcriptional regulator, zinc-responsive transcriptional repressor
LHKWISICLSISVTVPARTKAFEAAGELLKVLAAPVRLAIVMELAEQPRFVHELVQRLGLSQPLVSQHLRVLRGARLVGVERQGREAVYSLTDQHVAHIVADAVQHSREEQ